jgi:hypothetical protein
MLTGPQYRKLSQALEAAFQRPEDLQQMVRFGLGENLAAIAGGTNLRDMIFHLIQWADSRGYVDDLIIAARNERPRDRALLVIAEALQIVTGEPEPGAFERIVMRSVHYQDVEPWREQMSLCEPPICRIDLPGGVAGTGFLVGPDIVLTNYHLVEQAHHSAAVRRNTTLTFDRKVRRSGEAEGRRYQLSSAADWLLDHSPKEELDYALLRTEGSPGEDPVGGQQSAPPRGWIAPKAREFSVGEPLIVLQHPGGAPLKLAIGSVTEIRTQQARIIYSTNTSPGSSGSPCFTSDWECVALHHSGGWLPQPSDQSTHFRNEGILISAVLADLPG